MKLNKLIFPTIAMACLMLCAVNCNKGISTATEPAPYKMSEDNATKKFADWEGNWVDEQAKIFTEGEEQTGRVSMNITKPTEEGWMLNFQLKVEMPDANFRGTGSFGFNEAENKIHFRFQAEDNAEVEEQVGTWLSDNAFKVHHETTQDGQPYSEDNIWSKSEPDKWSLKYSDQLGGVKQFGMDVMFRRVK